MAAADRDTIDHSDTVVTQCWHILHHVDTASARLARHCHIGALVTSQGVQRVRGNNSQGSVVMMVVHTGAGSDDLLPDNHSPGSVITMVVSIGDSVLATDPMSVLLMILVTQHNTADDDG